MRCENIFVLLIRRRWCLASEAIRPVLFGPLTLQSENKRYFSSSFPPLCRAAFLCVRLISKSGPTVTNHNSISTQPNWLPEIPRSAVAVFARRQRCPDHGSRQTFARVRRVPVQLAAATTETPDIESHGANSANGRIRQGNHNWRARDTSKWVRAQRLYNDGPYPLLRSNRVVGSHC